MEPGEYEKMAAVELDMWWYRGLHGKLARLLRAALNGQGGLVLDAGCGTGGFLARWSALGGAEAPMVGLDYAPIACRHARQRGMVAGGSITHLPFADASLAAIVSADVLCHGAVDPVAALAECHRCLRPGGYLLLNLPAYRWMFSAHDRRVGNVRRYDAGTLRADLCAAGFEPLRLTYWNTLLFGLMLIRRKLLGASDAASDVMLYPAPVETLFGWLMDLETWFIAQGGRLPFGGSLLALARRPLSISP